jgi:hypothetical protein
MKYLAAVLMCALMASTSRAQGLTLAARGQPAAYAIVISTNASPSQRYAAEELQRFTERLTGVALPVVADDQPLPAQAVLLGETRHTAQLLGRAPDLAALGEDGFCLKACSPHVIVLAGPVRGTLYGVYELLERFGGCRWYASWHSVIPRLEALRVPADLDETQKPAFALREPFWFDMFDGDLAARNKVNGNAMRLSAKHGGHSHRFGGGLGSCHTFDALCPPELYFDAHPEYFSEISGRRQKEHTQLCLTNPDVLRIVTSNVLARIRKDPGADFYGVSQNDWYNFCTCPACKALDDAEESHAGTMIAFVNKIAEAVEKEHSDVIIETLAYQYTRKPPKTVRPRHNVMPCLCTIECDFSQPLDISGYEQNRKFVDDIRAWHAISRRLYLWDYTTNFRTYAGPFPNVLALQGNARFFRDNGVDYLFEQGAYQGRHGDFAELKAWLLAKWLWNPDLPQEALLQDFFAGYYGAAAPLARQYFNEVHAFYGASTNAPLRIFDDVKNATIPDAFYARSADLWQRAESAVKDSPAHLYNVRMAAIPALFARWARLPPLEEKEVWVTLHPERHDVPAEHRDLARELLARFNEAKNIRLSENYEHHEKILDAWRFLVQPLARPAAGQSKAVVEDAVLSLSKRGTWGDTVKDPLAEDGSAMKLYNTHYEWCTTLPFSRVAFDPGDRLRLRMRVRVEKAPEKSGEAFWAGVYDPKGKKGFGGCERKTADVGDDYAWYTVAEWQPEAAHYFWIGPGRFDQKGGNASAIRALYVDRLEIERLP